MGNGTTTTNEEFPEETLVTVSRPTGDFITGGGYLIEEATYGGTATLTKTLENSDGSTTVLSDEVDLDVADGSKMNFGFNVKWNNQLTNLQGQFTSILRTEDGTRWKIKSTATDTLLVDPETAQATFTAKANLINQATGYSQGGLRMIVNMTDVGEPGSQELDPDTIGFTLWDGPTLIFSTHWNGSETEERDLADGNLQVHLDELNVARGPATMAPASVPLTGAGLEPAVRGATALWSASGLSAQRLSLLDRVEVRTADLPGTMLGATFGPTVWIDRDGAGYGWGSAGVDLVSVVAHELGHALGFEHGSPYDVMAPSLAPRVRSLGEIIPSQDVPFGVEYAYGFNLERTLAAVSRAPLWVTDGGSAGSLETQWRPAIDSEVVPLYDQFFESLVMDSDRRASCKIRPRLSGNDQTQAKEIDGLSELTPELADDGLSTLDPREPLFDEAIVDALVRGP